MTEKTKNATPQSNNHEEKGNGNTVLNRILNKIYPSLHQPEKRILQILVKFGRQSSREIAKRLNMTSFEVSHKLKALYENGVVTSEITDTHSKSKLWNIARADEDGKTEGEA